MAKEHLIPGDASTKGVPYFLSPTTGGESVKVLVPQSNEDVIKAGAAIGPVGYSFDDYMHKVLLKRVAWIGDRYFSTPPGEQRILLVAESFYDREKNLPYYNPSEHLVRLIVSGEWRYAYYTRTRRMVSGDSSDSDIGKFWHGVSFYHYVQTPVSGGPRGRPTSQQWESGAGLFQQVILEASPSHVIFLGKELWRNVKVSGVIDETAPCMGRVKTNAQYPIAMATPHPSSFGFKPAVWNEIVRTFLSSKDK